MKYFLVILALMPLALGAEFQEILDANDRSISSQIVDAIEAAKLQMPCGFPGLGIPPLAPLKASHREVNIDGSSIRAAGEVDDFRVDGLDEFDIVEFKVNAILSRCTFEFNWKEVKMTTDYKMSTSLDNFRMGRSGPAVLTIKDFKITGRIRYSLGLVGSNGLNVKEITIKASVGEVKSEIEGLSKIKIINRKLNEVIEEWIMLAINDNTENMGELSNKYIMPAVNNLLEDTSLGDLIGMIGGGGGGEGGEPVEKVPCVPPEN